MRFSQWRPIGVCDHADGERKARMFAGMIWKVLAPGIGRNNWEDSLELRMIIERYAKDVAKPTKQRYSNAQRFLKSVGRNGAALCSNTRSQQGVDEGQVQLFEVSLRKDLLLQ